MLGVLMTLLFVAGGSLIASGVIPGIRAWREERDRWRYDHRYSVDKAGVEARPTMIIGWGFVVSGIVLLTISMLLPALLSLYADALWFNSMGAGHRFWTFFWTSAGLRLGGILLGVVAVWIITADLKLGQVFWIGILIASGTAVGFVTAGCRDDVIRWLGSSPTGSTDPLFGLDVAFYLFTLPLLHDVLNAVMTTLLIPWLAAAIYVWVTAVTDAPASEYVRALRFFLRIAGFTLIGFAGIALLSRLGLVLKSPRWTQVHVTSPGWALLFGAFLGAGARVLYRSFRPSKIEERVEQALRQRYGFHRQIPAFIYTGSVIGGIVVLMLLLPVAGFIVHRLYVVPREMGVEAPYVEQNIAWTRQAFGLRGVEEKTITVSDTLSRATVQANQPLLDEIRVWDWRALYAALAQKQELRNYYLFDGIDIDRYRIGGRYRQVMLAAREMETDSLPAESQRFVNIRLQYTHGYGLAVAPVNEFTPDMGPVLLAKDIPPASSVPELQIKRPEIYFGERTKQPVYVGTTEKEFDYPKGNENVLGRYAGKDGVPLTPWIRRLAIAWQTGDTPILWPGYVTRESRALLHREIKDRVSAIAPFLELDSDPYPVIDAANGGIVWMLDAYTTAPAYPYAARYRLHGDPVAYVRNPVKATVDAYNGTVTLYVFDESDPILKAWRNVFPELFVPAARMPATLRAHVRYPEDMFLVQRLVYARYHVKNTRTFFTHEDEWAVAQERHNDQLGPSEAYHIMWKPTPKDSTQFILTTPYTVRTKTLMSGWLTALSDGPNYGRLVAYEFDKDRQVVGPEQFESSIDQYDPISKTLSLWNQQGSKVLRGLTISVPIGDSWLYVKPLYLAATQSSAMPQLRMVVVMHGGTIAYGNTLPEAMASLIDQEAGRATAASATATAASGTQPAATPTSSSAVTGGVADQANAALESYMRLQGAGQFEAAGRELTKLRGLLQQLRQGRP